MKGYANEMNRFVTLAHLVARERSPLSSRPKFLHFHAVLGNNLQNTCNVLMPPFWLTPPPKPGKSWICSCLYHNCSFHLQISNFPFLGNAYMEYYSLSTLATYYFSDYLVLSISSISQHFLSQNLIYSTTSMSHTCVLIQWEINIEWGLNSAFQSKIFNECALDTTFSRELKHVFFAAFLCLST